jgi:hypothetical protein
MKRVKRELDTKRKTDPFCKNNIVSWRVESTVRQAYYLQREEPIISLGM